MATKKKCALQPVELLWHLFAARGQPFIHKHLEFGADVQWRALGRLVAGCLYRFRSEIRRRMSVCCLWSCALPNANNNRKCLCFHVCIHLRACWIWISVAVIPNGALSENVAIVCPTPVNQSQRCWHDLLESHTWREQWLTSFWTALEKNKIKTIKSPFRSIALPVLFNFTSAYCREV